MASFGHFYTVLLASLVTLALSSPLSTTTRQSECEPSDTLCTAKLMHKLTNDFRSENGLGPYKFNCRFYKLSIDLSKRLPGSFDHNSDQYRQANRINLENIAMVQGSVYDGGDTAARELIKNWISSTDGHREAMLSSEESAGMAMVPSGGSGYYGAQMFGELEDGDDQGCDGGESSGGSSDDSDSTPSTNTEGASNDDSDSGSDSGSGMEEPRMPSRDDNDSDSSDEMPMEEPRMPSGGDSSSGDSMAEEDEKEEEVKPEATPPPKKSEMEDSDSSTDSEDSMADNDSSDMRDSGDSTSGDSKPMDDSSSEMGDKDVVSVCVPGFPACMKLRRSTAMAMKEDVGKYGWTQRSGDAMLS